MTSSEEQPGATAQEFDGEVYDRVADILMVLSEVSAGEYSGRLTTSLPEEHPFGALNRGINEMVEALEQARRETLSYQRELEEKLSTIERQRAAIQELSTPVIEVWESVLCLPVVGVMDTARSVEMTDALMTALLEKRSRCVIIDITGIEVMDTRTADHFIRMAKAVRLLGAQCYLTGISPAIAQTIVHMGVDLSSIATRRNLRDALQEYVMGRRSKRPQTTDAKNGDAVQSTLSSR